MKYVNLGKAGLRVSGICLGMMTYGTPTWRKWVLDEEQSLPLIRRAIEFGINFFDTADMYSLGVSEEILGRAMREFGKRQELVLATKVFFPMGEDPNNRGLSRKHIFQSIDNSLRRLKTDYVDLYQIHRLDLETPMEELLEALNDIVREGKALYIGASSMFAWQFARCLYLADQHGWTRFVTMQNHYNLIYREEEREMIPFCRAEGIGIIPWSPMARGFLAGNRSRNDWGETLRAKTDDYGHKLYYTEVDFQIADRVAEVAKCHGVSPSQIALAWILHQPGVTSPIIGASRVEHLEQSVQALDISLNTDDLKYLEELYQPRPVLGLR